MIQEAYVSFEVAKLLKEKGFDEPCHGFYEFMNRLYHNDMDKYFPKGMTNSDHDKEGNKGVAAPTHQMACEWLRVNYKIHISPYQLSLGWYFEILNMKKAYMTGCQYLYSVGIPSKEMCLSSCNEATEAALKYVLENLI